MKVEGRRIIRAPVQKVFQLVSRLDALPRVTGLWLTADLVERKNNALTVRYRGYFAGIPVESVQRAMLHPPNRIDFRQSRGNLKAFRGQYQLKPIEGDTEVHLTVEAEAGMPLVSEEAAALVLHSFIERSLEKFKLAAERDLPRVVRKPQDGAAAREAEAPEAEQAPVEASALPTAAVAENGDAGAPAPPQPAAATKMGPPGQPGGRRKRRRRRRGRGGRGPGGPASAPEPGRGGSGSGSIPGSG